VNTVQRIAKNMAVLFLARIISMLFGFFYVMYTARYLGPANYGILSFALALNGIFGVVANFGLDPLTVREVARDKSIASKYLANGIVLKLLFGALTFLIVFAVVNFLGYPELTKKVVYIVTISTIIAGLNNLFNDVYQAFERMEFMAIGQILQSVLSLVFAITAIKLGLNVVDFAGIYLIVNLITLCYHVVVTTLKFLKPKVEVELGFWRRIVREAWPFALTAVFVSIYYWIDSVMLSYMKGDEVVGWYNAAYRLMLIFLIVPSIFNLAIFPTMSRLYVQSKKDLKYTFEQYLRYMIMLGLPLGVGVTLFARLIILLIYGTEYEASIKPLQILVWSAVFIYLSSPFSRVLEVVGKQSLITKITALGALLNVSLNLVFIPKFSLYGASFTTALTEFYVLIVLLWLTTREEFFLSKQVLLTFTKTCLAIIFATISAIALTKNFFVNILLFGGIYILLLILTRGITENDIKHLKEVIHL